MSQADLRGQGLRPLEMIQVLRGGQVVDPEAVLPLGRVQVVKGVRLELLIAVLGVRGAVLVLDPAAAPEQLLPHVVVVAEYHEDLGVRRERAPLEVGGHRVLH